MEDGGSPISGFIIFIGLLVINGLFYGFGSAIQSVNENSIEKKADEGDKRAIKLSELIDQPIYFINTIQIVVTLINMVVGYFYIRNYSGLLYDLLVHINSDLQKSVIEIFSNVLVTVILLFFILSFGIVVPKKVASKKSESWSYNLVGFIYGIAVICKPFNYLIRGVSNQILKLFGIDPYAKEEDVTEEEIMSMVNEGHEQGVILADEVEMITNIFEFGDTQAQDIMTHRKNIVAVDGNSVFSEVLDYILEQNNTRFPVYDEDIDNIIGILHLKNAMKLYLNTELRNKPIREIPDLVREASFITETRKINILFKNMQSQKIHMVIVIDEYGQTAGLVTMEDILEEIVGSILDEYDEDENFIIEQPDHSYIIAGITSIEDVEAVLGIELAENNSETLSGFLISKLDRIPEEGEEIEMQCEDYLFKVLAIDNKVIQSVHASKIITTSEDETDESSL